MIFDAFYPKLYEIKFSGGGSRRGKSKGIIEPKQLTQRSVPMVPGMLFLKTTMNPDIAVSQSLIVPFIHGGP